MPGVTFESDNEDFDSQGQSETFDEGNLVGDGDQGEVRTFADADARTTFEDLPEVLDVTQVGSDRDDETDVRRIHGDLGPVRHGDGGFERPDQAVGVSETYRDAASLAEFEASEVSDSELIDLGYAELADGQVRAKPND